MHDNFLHKAIRPCTLYDICETYDNLTECKGCLRHRENQKLSDNFKTRKAKKPASYTKENLEKLDSKQKDN